MLRPVGCFEVDTATYIGADRQFRLWGHELSAKYMFLTTELFPSPTFIHKIFGLRIIIGWDPNSFTASLLSKSDQVMQFLITFVTNGKSMYISFVDGENHEKNRVRLWKNLEDHKNVIGCHSWVMLGDFNVTLYLDDWDVFYVDSEDEKPEDGDFEKVRFQNFLAEKEGFLKIVRDNWNVPIKGYAMYVLARRLRLVKKHMRSINRRNGNVFSNVHKLKVKLQRVQMDLNKDPYYSALREEEIIYTNAYKEALLDEETFLIQKSKIEWLKEGDQNNAYFYNYIKGRMSKSRIDLVYDHSGTCFTCTDVAKISDSDSLDLVKPVSNDEIKAAVRNYCKQT
ncbi:hypothetical protein Tco_0618279 [Tanacetum coccineum]